MLNIACIMGRLAADPELRHTQSQVPVTTFRVAVDRNYQPKGQEKQTDWIDVVAWRNTAEFISKYFRKGSMIVVQGSIQTRSYDDREGNKRWSVEIVADQVFFGEPKRDDGNSTRFQAQTPQFNEAPPAFSTAAPADFEEIIGDDELPF